MPMNVADHGIYEEGAFGAVSARENHSNKSGTGRGKGAMVLQNNELEK